MQLRTSAGVLLALSLAACTQTPPVGLHLGWEGDPHSTLTISWQAEAPGGSCVYAGPREAVRREAATSTPFGGGWMHRVELTGLEPGTRYVYRCGDGDGALEAAAFSTAVRPGEPFRFVAWGDSRSNPEDRRAVRAAVEARAPAFTVFTGDLVEDGRSEAQWAQWFEDMQPLLETAPFLPSLGNHEEAADAYFDRFVLPRGAEGVPGYRPEAFYGFDYGSVHFLALSTDPLGEVGGPQYRWAEADLKAARADPDVEFIVVFGHRPPYSGGAHGSAEDVRAWMPLFERHGVDVALWGHDHDYERTVPIADGVRDEAAGVVHVVTGGAGAPLRPVTPGPLTAQARSVLHFVEVSVAPGAMTLQARDVAGRVFDSVRITPRTR